MQNFLIKPGFRRLVQIIRVKLGRLNPGYRLKLFIKRHLPVGADTFEYQVNHINFLFRAVRVGFDTHVTRERSGRDAGYLQGIARLLTNLPQQRLIKVFASFYTAAGKRLLSGKNTPIVGHLTR